MKKTKLDMLMEYIEEESSAYDGENAQMEVAAEYYLKSMVEKIGGMMDEMGDGFADELERHHGIDYPYPRQWLLEELIKKLQELV
jgi:hypothetical protein